MDIETNPVTFSESALIELQKLQTNLSVLPHLFLRIGIKGGGCSGINYLLAFDDKNENDREFLIDGMIVIMNRMHVMHVLGLHIDWENNATSKGFVFLNSNQDIN